MLAAGQCGGRARPLRRGPGPRGGADVDLSKKYTLRSCSYLINGNLGKIIFAAPSRPLVAQQIEACHNTVGIPQECAIDLIGNRNPSSRSIFWKSKRVFFVTPQILQNDIKSGICMVNQIVCLVIDEAHRASGNFAYCTAIRELLAAHVPLRILALTATPGSKHAGIQSVIDNLCISELIYCDEEDSLVKQYVNTRKVKVVEVPLGSDATQVNDMLLDIMRPHFYRLRDSGVIDHRDDAKWTPFELLKYKEKFMEAPPSNIREVERREIARSFIALGSLLHIRKLLSSHGIQQARKFLEEKLKKGSLKLMRKNELFWQVKEKINLVSSQGSTPKIQELIRQMVDYFIHSSFAVDFTSAALRIAGRGGIAMAFGSKKRKEAEMEHEAPEHMDSGDEIDPIEADEGGEEEEEETEVQNHTKRQVLLEQVTILYAGKGKNPGGSKGWQCKHCKKKFSSSSTRIQMHFFGAGPGKKAQISRCTALQSNRAKYKELYEKIQKLRGSSKPAATQRHNPVADAFGMIERDAVDMAIMRCLCANGIPFNVLRSPQWSEMVAAINKGPKGYKSPSSEKARTSLLDACKRNVEQDLGALKNTWYATQQSIYNAYISYLYTATYEVFDLFLLIRHTHGVSIVSDGWTNMKNKPLINVIASNSRGSMFLYADDFSGIEKTGEAIADYLLKAIEDIGASMVMQVVTDNASNCKAAGREIEKVRICHLLTFFSL
ncbi:uncharacterized protein LOC120684617 isoform X2 [Panicum virgatum]|uniref:uncharacterized protein LOC120684617 isoform X2 n=1 Tax=Panicum virgatum TaxID=38727 RepID=UPI0019D5FAC9|nr:uncharacterized protein LOC120684617 isoform X2 [Panicum virgatum]